MKRLSLIILIFLMLGIHHANSQKIILKGDKYLNFGLGTTLGPYVGYDIGLKRNLTIGGALGVNFLYDVGIYVVARANYHLNEKFSIPEKFDVYAGVTTGALNHLLFAGQAGVCFAYNEKWDINLEVSTGAFFERNTGVYLYGRVGVARKIFTKY